MSGGVIKGCVRGKTLCARGAWSALLGALVLFEGLCVSWAGTPNVREFFKSDVQASSAEAAASGRTKELEKLVASGADVNAKGLEGMTALYWAMAKSSKQGVAWLLEHGADPNVIFARDGTSTTSLAAMHEDPWFLKEVLAHGGDVNFRNPENKRTPIFDALAAIRDENVRVLIAAGANLDTVNRLGLTPMMGAAAIQRYDLVYDMLKAGADPTVKINPTVKIPKAAGNKTILSIVRRSTVPPGAPMYEWQLKVIDLLKQKGLDVEHGD